MPREKRIYSKGLGITPQNHGGGVLAELITKEHGFSRRIVGQQYRGVPKQLALEEKLGNALVGLPLEAEFCRLIEDEIAVLRRTARPARDRYEGHLMQPLEGLLRG